MIRFLNIGSENSVNIDKYLDEVHRDTMVLYKLGREDLSRDKE